MSTHPGFFTVEHQLTVNVQPRRKTARSLHKLIAGLGLGHETASAACNAAKLISEHDDVISVTVDLVATGRIAVFGHGKCTR